MSHPPPKLPSSSPSVLALAALLWLPGAGCAVDNPVGTDAPSGDGQSRTEPDASLETSAAIHPDGAVDGASEGWLLLESCDGAADLPVMWLGGGCETPPSKSPAGDRALHLAGAARPEGGELSTHHHLDWRAPFTALRFWARSGAPGTAPTELVVAFTELGTGTTRADLYTDQRAGRAWRGKRVALGPDWQLQTIHLDELAPLSPGTPVPVYGPSGNTGGSEIHLVAPADRPFDIWVDQVEMACRNPPCS